MGPFNCSCTEYLSYFCRHLTPNVHGRHAAQHDPKDTSRCAVYPEQEETIKAIQAVDVSPLLLLNCFFFLFAYIDNIVHKEKKRPLLNNIKTKHEKRNYSLCADDVASKKTLSL